MDIAALAEKFLNSEHGQAAAAELGQQGIGDDQVQQILGHAASAGAEHVEEAHKQTAHHHGGMSFFAAFASGIIKGDGIFGALEDGAIGVVIGRITDKLQGQMGMDSGMADAAAASTAPYVLRFLKEHIGL